MRLKFLQSSVAGDAPSKLESVLDSPGLSTEERQGRESLEQERCFTMLTNWRECVLGIGLFVHPRTVRERRKRLPPEVDLVPHYVSAEAYNLGVRAAVEHTEREDDLQDTR